MTTIGTVITLSCILLPLGLGIGAILRQHWLAEGTWLVECPETESYVDVCLAAKSTTTGSLWWRGPRPEVVDCEHWPAKQGCAQTCIRRPGATSCAIDLAAREVGAAEKGMRLSIGPGMKKAEAA